MTQFTNELPNSVEHVDRLEISPKFSMVRVLGYLAAWASVLSVCALPYGYLSILHGSWNAGADRVDSRPILLGIFLTAAMGVSVLGICAGVASGSGKPWSRAGMMIYADLTIVLAIVGVLPFYLFAMRSPVMDLGQKHAMEMLVVLKLWVVELPLAIAILYCFTRSGVESAYQHPELKSPDRSQR